MSVSLLLLDEPTLAALLAAPGEIHRLVDDLYEAEDMDDNPHLLTLEASWHGLHYLLTQTAWEGEPPLDFIVRGGTPVGTEDVGHGPARAYRPHEVAAIHAAIDALPVAELVARYDGRAMTAVKIYRGNWDDAPQANVALLTDAYAQLGAFVARGAAAGLGLLVWC